MTIGLFSGLQRRTQWVKMVRRDSRLRTKTSRYLSQRSSSSSEAPDPAKSSKPPSRDGGGGGFSHSARPDTKDKDQSSKTVNGTDYMKGRLPIKAATMNLSGQSVMGLTPAYKLNYIRYLGIIIVSFNAIVVIVQRILGDPS